MNISPVIARACFVASLLAMTGSETAAQQTPRESQFYLASQSPRRSEILQKLGFTFQTVFIDIDETPLPHELADAYVQRVAQEKAIAGLYKTPENNTKEKHKIVLAADTAVIVDDQILSKPKDINHATRMLKLLSGRQHTVYTAVCVAIAEQDFKSAISKSTIDFAELSTQEIKAYCDTGEPLDKAGGYGIQGLAAAFIKKIEGSYSGVMGLPIYETVQLLKNYGINLFNE